MFRYNRLLGPGILLIGVLSSLIMSESGYAPRLGELLRNFFLSVGLLVLPLIVFIEYLYGLNFFFPGALTILFAMSSSSGNLRQATLIFIIIWIFSLAGTLVSYFLGRAENIDTQIGRRIEKPTARFAALVVYGHPLTASIRAFQRGADSVGLRGFLPELLIGNGCWNVFWGLVAYNYGGSIVGGNTFAWLLLLYAVYWFRREWQVVRQVE